MENIIEINNLSFRYGNKFIFDRLSLNIRRGEWISIVGPNGSGKSTLVKILVGLYKNDDTIIIDNVTLSKNNVMSTRKKIGVVFENVDDQFVAETVRDEIAFALENLLFEPKDIHHMVNKVAQEMNIKHLLEREPHRLSGGEKQKVAIASALITNPKVLILDEALSMINDDEREEILSLLKKIHQETALTIINVTHNLEESYYGNRIVVLKDGDVLLDGPTMKILKEDRIFSRIGLEVPFMVDLSLKLKLYGLVDDIILDMDKMVNQLWK